MDKNAKNGQLEKKKLKLAVKQCCLVGLNSLENTINETFGVILKQCARGANGVVMLL